VLLVTALPVAAVELKIATLAPDGTAWMQELRKGAGEIARRTDGRVNFKFYPGGSMGSDRAVLRKIRAGQLHGGALTGGALGEVDPDTQIYSLPYLFRSTAELDYVRTRMDKTFAQGLEQRGFVSFGFSDGGFAYLMSSTPIKRVDELKGQKVWIPEGDDITRAIFESLGVSPVPLPLTDVLTGLQTGLVTTIGSSAIGAIALQWHTRVKYVTDTPAMYLYGSLAVDKKAYARLTPADQTIVREVMERVFVALNRQNRIDDRNAHEALRKQGIRFVNLEPAELAKLHAAADQTIERLGKQGQFSVTLLRRVQEHLADYRRTHAAAR
jgi:TRAP-type C4-dicarboxylate transport system substrate-binding protein